jgi:hypothetical protein
MRVLGPGLITGASDDDPSGIATYSQAGAQFGFAISWTMLFSYPLMVAIQQISARIGRTTGKGIAGNLRQHYPNWLLQGIVALLLVANTINIGADLGAMADALRLLIGGPLLIYVIAFGVLCAILPVFVAYARYVCIFWHGDGRGYSLDRGGARLFDPDLPAGRRVLDGRGRGAGDHHQPVSVFLAGGAGGRGYPGRARTQAAREGAAPGAGRDPAHPAGHLRWNGVLESGGARDHRHHRGDAPRQRNNRHLDLE